MAAKKNTRIAILDAAERLFAESGYDGVSIRQITREAGVGLALATYHFTSKEALFAEAIARRAAVLSERRRMALQALQDADAEPDVESIIEAFIGPLHQFSTTGGKGWAAYNQIIVRIVHENRWLALIDEHFGATAKLFVEAFARALPDADKTWISRCFILMTGCMTSTYSGTKRLRSLHANADPGLERAYRDVVAFAAQGMKAHSRFTAASRAAYRAPKGALTARSRPS